MPDYIRAAKVHELQVAYKEYARVQTIYYNATGFNDDGVFYCINSNDLKIQIDEASNRLTRALSDLQEYDRLEKTHEYLSHRGGI